MKKYIRIRNSLYETVDIVGAIFLAALAAMLISATWLTLDWLCRNQISVWAVVTLISSTVIDVAITAIFSSKGGK